MHMYENSNTNNGCIGGKHGVAWFWRGIDMYTQSCLLYHPRAELECSVKPVYLYNVFEMEKKYFSCVQASRVLWSVAMECTYKKAGIRLHAPRTRDSACCDHHAESFVWAFSQAVCALHPHLLLVSDLQLGELALYVLTISIVCALEHCVNCWPHPDKLTRNSVSWKISVLTWLRLRY